MIPLPKPRVQPADVFDLCIGRVRNADVARNLRSIRHVIATAGQEYDDRGIASRLNEIAQSDELGGCVPGDEMRTTYKSRMVKSGQPGREIYDSLRLSSPNRKCPYCNHRSVKTLDHFLPKESFSAHAVNPWNLVPSCSDCNKEKLAVIPAHPDELLLHPYYDNVAEHRWLFARVEQTAPAVTRFEIRAPSALGELARRIEGQFALLGLGELYSAEAANELVSRRYRLTELLHDAGGDQVRQYLVGEARSAGQADRNSWRFAALDAWSASVWFIEGGFAQEG